MKRSAVVVLGMALALVGCRDMGLEGNAPLVEAEQAPPSDLVVAVHEAEVQRQELIVEGRLWVPSGLPWTLAEDGLRPVGSAGGATVYARSWDEAPYDELFTRLPRRTPEAGAPIEIARDARWQGYAPVLGGGGGPAAPVGGVEPTPAH